VRSGKAFQRKSKNIHSVLPTKQLIDGDKLSHNLIYPKWYKEEKISTLNDEVSAALPGERVS
jgi:hypothetical protein